MDYCFANFNKCAATVCQTRRTVSDHHPIVATFHHTFDDISLERDRSRHRTALRYKLGELRRPEVRDEFRLFMDQITDSGIILPVLTRIVEVHQNALEDAQTLIDQTHDTVINFLLPTSCRILGTRTTPPTIAVMASGCQNNKSPPG